MLTITSLKHTSAIPDNLEEYSVVIVTFHFLGAIQSDEEHYDTFHKRRWHRVVIDEGHTMGKGQSSHAHLYKSSTYTRFGTGTRTKSRDAVGDLVTDHLWIVSGTPTPSIASDTGLGYARRLLHVSCFSCPLLPWCLVICFVPQFDGDALTWSCRRSRNRLSPSQTSKSRFNRPSEGRLTVTLPQMPSSSLLVLSAGYVFPFLFLLFQL